MASLRSLRRQAGFSQPQLSRKSGVNQTTISMLELGKVPGPRSHTLHRLALALRQPVAAVLIALNESVRHRRIRQARARSRQAVAPTSILTLLLHLASLGALT